MAISPRFATSTFLNGFGVGPSAALGSGCMGRKRVPARLRGINWSRLALVVDAGREPLTTDGLPTSARSQPPDRQRAQPIPAPNRMEARSWLVLFFVASP